MDSLIDYEFTVFSYQSESGKRSRDESVKFVRELAASALKPAATIRVSSGEGGAIRMSNIAMTIMRLTPYDIRSIVGQLKQQLPPWSGAGKTRFPQYAQLLSMATEGKRRADSRARSGMRGGPRVPKAGTQQLQGRIDDLEERLGHVTDLALAWRSLSRDFQQDMVELRLQLAEALEQIPCGQQRRESVAIRSQVDVCKALLSPAGPSSEPEPARQMLLTELTRTATELCLSDEGDALASLCKHLTFAQEQEDVQMQEGGVAQEQEDVQMQDGEVHAVPVDEGGGDHGEGGQAPAAPVPRVPPGPPPHSPPNSPPGPQPPADPPAIPPANLLAPPPHADPLHDVRARFEALAAVLSAAAAEDGRASVLLELCQFDDTIALTLVGLQQRPILNGEFFDVIGANASAQRLEVRIQSSGEEVRVKPGNTDDPMEAWFLFYAICFGRSTDIDLYHMAGAIHDLSFTEAQELSDWVLPTRMHVGQSLPWLRERWFDILE